MVPIRRIAELGDVSDSGGQTPQAHVGGTFVFPPVGCLTEAARVSHGMSGCFHVGISVSSEILWWSGEISPILGKSLCRGIAPQEDLTS